MPAFLHHLTAALCAQVLLLIGAVTAGLVLAIHAGLFGLPLAIVLTWAVASYALVLLESRAHGNPIPLLSIEMINIAHHPRPLGALIIVGIWVSCIATLGNNYGVAAGIAVTAVALVAVPAMIVLLCIDDTWYCAVSPVHLWRLVLGIGLRYVAFLLVATLYCAIAAWAAWVGPLAVKLAVVQFAVLSLSLLLGGVVYDRRDELGVDAWNTPEREHAKAAAEDDRQREKVIHEMYGLLRANKPQECWDCAAAWLGGRADTRADLRWLRDRIAGWEDRRVADRVTRELVSQHLRCGDNAAAVEVVQAWIGSGGTYRPAQARDLGRLVGLARMSGRPELADRLLDECSEEFATSPEIASMLDRRRRERSGSGGS